MTCENASEIRDAGEGSHLVKTSNEKKKEIIRKNTNINAVCVILVGVVASQVHNVCCAVSAAAVEFLQRAIPDFELNAFRALFPLVINCIRIVCYRRLPRIPREGWIVTFLLIFTDWIETMANYASVSFIPLTAYSGIVMTVRLLFGLFFFRIFLKQSCNIINITSVIICVVGAILIIQPYSTNFDSPNLERASSKLENNTNEFGHTIFGVSIKSNNYIIGCLFAGVTGIFVTFSVSASKKLSEIINLTELIWHIMFWQYLFHFSVSIIISFIVENPILPTTKHELIFTALHGISYTLIFPALLLTAANVTTNPANILLSMEPAYQLAMQYIFMKNVMPGHRNWQEVLGLFVALGGAILATVWECISEYYKH